MFLSNLRYVANVIRVAQLPQGRHDMLAGNGLLGFPFGDFVGLGRQKGDKLHAAFDQEVPRVFCKGQAAVVAEDFGDDLSNGGCEA